MTIPRIKSGPFFFGGGCIGLDRIKTNNQERIINDSSKQVQLIFLHILRSFHMDQTTNQATLI